MMRTRGGFVSAVDGQDAHTREDHDVSTERRILVTDLDVRSRSALE